jgi:hypothetical protein
LRLVLEGQAAFAGLRRERCNTFKTESMNRGKRWAIGLGVVATVLAAAGFVAIRALPSDEELRIRLVAEAEKRLGVAVSIGSVHWALLPRPVVMVSGFRTQQPEPIVIGQISAHPKAASLLRLRPAFARITIRDAVFPRESVRAFRGRFGRRDARGSALDRFEFRNVTWISYSRIPVVYDGDVDFDADWRPRRAELSRPGAETPFTFAVAREGGADRWAARVHVGGGTMHGNLELEIANGGTMRLTGELTPRDVEVLDMMKTFNRRSVISGKAAGLMTISAAGDTIGALVRSLHTRTTFSVSPATITRFDLDKAVTTLGAQRQGQTPLEELTGQLDTQNTDEGMRATYTRLAARSGRYSATGEATIYRREVDGSGVLYMEENDAKLPFTVKGPVTRPSTSFPPGALAAAAVKSRGFIARIRDAFRRIFNPDEAGEEVESRTAPR